MVKRRYKFIYTKHALKDAKLVSRDPKLKVRVEELLAILAKDPFTPPCKALVGKYKGAYSRRINRQHRLVYQVIEETQTIKVLRMWTHSGD